jgi:hypothetical protein
MPVSNSMYPYLSALNSNFSKRTPNVVDKTSVDESSIYTIGTNRAPIGFENREKT